MKPLYFFPNPQPYHFMDLIHDKPVGHALMTKMTAWRLNNNFMERNVPVRWLPCDCAEQLDTETRKEAL